MNKDTLAMIDRLRSAGISLDDALKLRRIAMTLHVWSEQECGNSDNYKSWCIVRDDETDKPFMEVHPYDGKSYRYRINDRERGAKKRLAKIMSRYPDLTAYIQGDPRGAPLYIIRKGDVPAGERVDAYYNRGLAVYR